MHIRSHDGLFLPSPTETPVLKFCQMSTEITFHLFVLKTEKTEFVLSHHKIFQPAGHVLKFWHAQGTLWRSWLA